MSTGYIMHKIIAFSSCIANAHVDWKVGVGLATGVARITTNQYKSSGSR